MDGKGKGKGNMQEREIGLIYDSGLNISIVTHSA